MTSGSVVPMKQSSLLLCMVVAVTMAVTARAGSVTLSTVSGSQFASKDGASLPVGCALRIGTFNLPDAARDTTVQSTGDYAKLKTWFKPLAEGIVGAGTPQQAGGSGDLLRANSFPATGNVFGTISDVSISYMPPGSQLYVWVFNHENPDQATQWGIFTLATWQAPPALGNATLSTTGEVIPLQGTAVEGQLRLTPPLPTYGNWTWQNYTLTAAPAVTDANADPDRDGIANLAEYAWQLNALTADKPRTSVETDTSTGKQKFVFKSPRALGDVQVTAERSLDLKTWSPATTSLVASDSVFDTLATEAPNESKCFWRVRFTAVTAP